MKNQLLYLSLLCFTAGISQTPVFPVEALYPTEENHPNVKEYYKDIDNLFNQYEGTWLHESDGKSLKLELKKFELSDHNAYYIDLLVGEYQYSENGTIIVNTLSQIENSYTSGCRHSICGYSIEDSCFYHPVSDC
ncbi:DUF6705 family protein, partial [Gangjinia marincola]|uniref:DUF6705 family protein n=1 Tax=Gangjinia marincola TaxID=578463 RepID=UPI0031D5A4B0